MLSFFRNSGLTVSWERRRTTHLLVCIAAHHHPGHHRSSLKSSLRTAEAQLSLPAPSTVAERGKPLTPCLRAGLPRSACGEASQVSPGRLGPCLGGRCPPPCCTVFLLSSWALVHGRLPRSAVPSGTSKAGPASQRQPPAAPRACLPSPSCPDPHTVSRHARSPPGGLVISALLPTGRWNGHAGGRWLPSTPVSVVCCCPGSRALGTWGR